jgi:hypothetical protein
MLFVLFRVLPQSAHREKRHRVSLGDGSVLGT